MEISLYPCLLRYRFKRSRITGSVSITVPTGRKSLLDFICLSFVEDKDMVEDLVAAAVNDAVRRVDAATQEKMSGLTMGMPMPPGFKLPF